MNKYKMEDFARACFEKNDFINGVFDYRDGDLSSLINAAEDFETPVIVDSLLALYQLCKEYTGAYIWHNVVVFSSARNSGAFVYVYPDSTHYKEHLSMNLISEDRFREIIRGLSDGTY